MDENRRYSRSVVSSSMYTQLPADTSLSHRSWEPSGQSRISCHRNCCFPCHEILVRRKASGTVIPFAAAEWLGALAGPCGWWSRAVSLRGTRCSQPSLLEFCWSRGSSPRQDSQQQHPGASRGPSRVLGKLGSPCIPCCTPCSQRGGFGVRNHKPAKCT